MQQAKNNLFSLFLVLLFVFFAVGFYTFYNAKGFSYFSNDSAACNNCHVMNEVYYDYTKSPHSKVVDGKPLATCSDCHIPDGFAHKWIAKAQSGISHAYAFTFKLDDLPTNFTATQRTKGWVQNNCIRCHSDMAAAAVNATLDPHKDSALKCVSCHQGVGHKRDF